MRNHDLLDQDDDDIEQQDLQVKRRKKQKVIQDSSEVIQNTPGKKKVKQISIEPVDDSEDES